jgi:RNA polymerase sigma-70 factor (ECF subfamily)
MRKRNGVVQTELVTAAQGGDADAFAALARLSADRLYAVAVRVTKDRYRAEDALQQALIAAWKELPRLRDPERFEAWTYRLVVRFAVQEARGSQPNRLMFALPEHQSTPGDAVAAVATRDQLERGFRRLTPEQRAVIVLHFYAGLSLAEIADVIGVPLGTVGSRLHYAKRALRAALEADDRVEERTG